MASTYRTLVGDPPVPTLRSWRDWYYRLLKARLDEVPLARTTTYYVATNGNDSNSGLTTALPFATLAKVQAVLTASAGDVRFRFRRGDVWEESTGITVAKDNVTLDDWFDSTTGFKLAPRFSRFLLKYNSAGWTLAAGNRYTRAETSNVTAVRYQQNPFSPILIQAASSAECEATSNSFFWGSNVLHLNLGGTNPNTLNLEACADNTNPGILGNNVDGLHLRNLRVDGFGCSATTGSYGIKIQNSSLKNAIVENCEAYYSGDHCFGHSEGAASTSGGVCTFVNCKAGLARIGGSGVCFVSHNGNGGQETIWHGCEATYGKLPATSWYNSVSLPRQGGAIFGHTGGPPYKIGLAISYGLQIANNAFGCASGMSLSTNDTPPAATLEAARVFIVGETMLGVQPCGQLNLGLTNHVYLNCSYHVTLQSGVSQIQDSQCQGWVINTSLIAEHSNALYNGGAQGPHFTRWWHSRIDLVQNTIGAATVDTLYYAPSAGQLDGTVASLSFFNCILRGDPVNGSTPAINTRNHANNLGGNAYAGILRYTNGGNQGYDADLSAVQLTTPPTLGLAPDTSSPLYRTGVALPGGYLLEYDARWQARNTIATPSIGPVAEESDFTSVMATTLAIADNAATPTGVIATVSLANAAASVRLDYQQADAGFTAANWLQGNSRTGNGTISQSLPKGIYWFRLVSMLTGQSAVSNLVMGKVTSGVQAVHEQILLAFAAGVRTLIAAGSLPGIVSSDRAYDLAELDLKAMDLPGIAVCISLPRQVPAEVIGRGTNARDDIGYPIYVVLLDRFDGDFVSPRPNYLRCREVLFRYFRFQHLANTDVHTVRVEPGPVLAMQQGDFQLAASVLLFRPEVRDVRG